MRHVCSLSDHYPVLLLWLVQSIAIGACNVTLVRVNVNVDQNSEWKADVCLELQT